MTTTTTTDKHEGIKPTGRRYRSIRDLIKGERLSERVAKEFEDIRASTRLSRQLAEIRLKAGLTQQQMAERLGVSQGCISKWESEEDDLLEVRVLKLYAEVTGERIGLMIGRPMSHVEAIKGYAFAMRDRLRALAALAHQHDELECHIQAFFGDAFFNILHILGQAQQEMPKSDAIELRIETTSSDPVVRKVAPAPSLRGRGKLRAAEVEKEESETAGV